MIIQYDGTEYSGWQIQKHKPTIQQKIQDALRTYFREDILINGAGRTDSGAHALGQVANFHINNKIDIKRVKFSLNALLSKDIVINSISEVNEDFHSRFSATKRSYYYLVSHKLSPFYYKYSYLYKKPINYKLVNETAALLYSVNDFEGLSKVSKESEHY